MSKADEPTKRRHENKYKHLRAENPITALWRLRKEQKRTVGNFARRMKMCANKKSFDTKQNAESAAETKQFNNKVYQCPVCKKWHTASRAKRKRL